MIRFKKIIGLLAKLHTRVIATVIAGIVAPFVAKRLGFHLTAAQLAGYIVAVGGAAGALQKLLSPKNVSTVEKLLAAAQAQMQIAHLIQSKGKRMASISSVSASPTSVGHGGVSDISVVVDNPQTTATITVSLDGQSGTTSVELSETLTFSVDAADQGKTGFVVATVDQGGTLAVGADGKSFVFTAS